jgi:hypothetical protein
MTEKLAQTIKEEVAQLPVEMEEAINAFDWIKVTEEIGRKYELAEDEIHDFQLETLLVLIGAVEPEFYEINIENQVNTTKEKARSMAHEALERIFRPIKNTIVANIQKGGQIKNSDFEQNIDFVLSGGDYSSFMKKKVQKTTDSVDKKNLQANLEKTLDIKRKLVI